MNLLKDKKGMMELMQNEIIKLIIVAIVGIALLYFIYSSISGEASILLSKSREDALWIDAAMNSPKNAETSLKLHREFEDLDGKYKLTISKENNLVISKEELVEGKLGEGYRIISNGDNVLEVKESDSYFEVDVK